MVTLPELWLPLLLSAAVVWVASFMVWTMLPWHQTDYRGLPDEEATRAALKDVPPGQYNIPHVASRKDFETPEAKAKFDGGPVGFMVLLPKGVPHMGKRLAQWFAFNIAVAIVAAYVADRALPPGAEYLEVFRVTGTVTWAAYGLALVQDAVWFGRSWRFIVEQLFDALIYALLTAGFFGWLWPALPAA